MSSVNTSQNLQVILTDPTKWDEWETAFLSTARDRALLDYVEGTRVLPQRPIPPNPKDYYNETGPAEGTRSSSASQSQTLQLEENEQITTQNLTTKQRSVYNTEFANFKYLNDTFKSEHKEVTTLHAWMRMTVLQEYAVNTLDPAEDVQTAYQNLKDQAGTGGMAHVKQTLIDDYQKMMTPWK